MSITVTVWTARIIIFITLPDAGLPGPGPELHAELHAELLAELLAELHAELLAEYYILHTT